jgi:signal transduction histidine kinase
MNLKLSSLIALKFTLYVAILLFLVGLLINWLFFAQWYKGESIKMTWSKRSIALVNASQRKWNRVPIIQPLFEQVRVLPWTDEMRNELAQWVIFDRLIGVDGQYILISQKVWQNKVWKWIGAPTALFIDVSSYMQAQKRLLRITFLIIGLCTLITFAVSRRFVKSSLGRVNTLKDFVQGLDLHSLDQRIPPIGPEDDEIQIIADKLQESLDAIKQQADNLKDFVASASHELKTPLMAMNSLVDLAQKTGNYEKVSDKLKKQIHTMNTLFEILIKLTHLEFESLEKSQTDIVKTLVAVANDVQSEFPGQTIDLVLPPEFKLASNEPALRMIVSNLLTNACKFTLLGKRIEMRLVDSCLIIRDEGLGIASEDLPRIWERLWKKDWSVAGSGIGLYLVKILIEKLRWNIEVSSTKDVGTQFVITFDSLS